MIESSGSKRNDATLARQAYERMREMIATLTLAPGEVVSEAILSVRLGIGRTPVREAIRELARDNLVVILPKRGIVISRIDLHEQILVLEVLRGLEPLLVSRAARRSTVRDRAEFEALACRLEKSRDAGDIGAYLTIDHEFDDLVDKCAQNHFASEAIGKLHVLWRRFWASQAHDHRIHQAFTLNIALVRSIVTGDPVLAAAAANEMLDFNDATVRDLMS